MSTQQYNVMQHPISALLTWINTGVIAIPEIQRPFVWDATKVRDLLDSLLQGFPVGYLIAWQNPDVKLKDGTLSSGKKILIDGQQRVTALMAALLGREVMDKDYRPVRIRISYHPGENRFEVHNPAIAKDGAWLGDIATVFDPKTNLFDLVKLYCEQNPESEQNDVFQRLALLLSITNNQIGLIELAPELDIETVTEIFIRVNSQGMPLGQADFAMSKIAVDEAHGGSVLRKAIDYFCHLAVTPEFFKTIERNDTAFAQTDFFKQMAWLKNENDDLYDPSYTDLLRVSFTSEFRRGRLQDLVALLSGRNFETRQFEEAIVEDSFIRLRSSVLNFMNENHFKTFTMIIKSAGFVDSSMVGSQSALDFAYILYLLLRQQGTPTGEIERHVRRWFVLSVLTGRYSGSVESSFDYDIRQIHAQGIQVYAEDVFRGALSDAFWSASLPTTMDTSVASSPYFRVFQAAQVKMHDKGFLSRDIDVQTLIQVKSDVHHIFPRGYLKRHGIPRGQYNQIANYAVTQSEINIAIGEKEPSIYFAQLREQVNGNGQKYGNIVDPEELRENLRINCIPEGIEQMTVEDYPAFLAQRRQLMAQKIKAYFTLL
jgi:hypothetical protein